MAFTFLNLDLEVAPFELFPTTKDFDVFTPEAHPLILIYTANYDDTEYPEGWPFHKRTDGYISGTTIDETAAVMPDVLITCLWNKNMAIVCTTKSNSSGVWQVNGLDPDDTYGYTIIAQDPETGTVYNTVSYDKIIPAAPV
jgi:hypothetical protein